ncbi:MAG: HD domain-containing protein [Treponema sp.]|jgi:response regulator RpfG family c-di-GMP phosphodiesterase|nr:HD domain-containing protein [Treponema sp.]
MTVKETNYESILRIDSELNQIQDLDILLERILKEAREVVHADAGSIYVKETEAVGGESIDRLVIKYAQNDTQQQKLPPGQKLFYSKISLPINKSTISGYCALTGQLVNVPDVYNISEDAPYSFSPTLDKLSNYKTISTLAIPLSTAAGSLLGVIQIINAQDRNGNTIPFSQNDEFLLTHFAATVTVALQRAYVTRSMILRMIRMSEFRDPKETGPHVNRVAGYAVEIYEGWARRHEVPGAQREKFRDILKVSSMLHDVGKVAISDMILKKPGRFTDEEYLVMKHHTIYGARLFEDLHSELDMVSRDIALTHHENWNGSGYPGWVDPVTEKTIKADSQGNPRGKKEEEIPFAGRIVALADVYDALCSRRVYKDPWTEDQVLSEIQSLRETKFDPELTDIFFETLPNIQQVQSLYPEQTD